MSKPQITAHPGGDCALASGRIAEVCPKPNPTSVPSYCKPVTAPGCLRPVRLTACPAASRLAGLFGWVVQLA